MIRVTFPKHESYPLEPEWVTQQGRSIPVSQINNQHLLNIRKALLRGQYPDRYEKWYPIIMNQIRARALVLEDDNGD